MSDLPSSLLYCMYTGNQVQAVDTRICVSTRMMTVHDSWLVDSYLSSAWYHVQQYVHRTEHSHTATFTHATGWSVFLQQIVQCVLPATSTVWATHARNVNLAAGEK